MGRATEVSLKQIFEDNDWLPSPVDQFVSGACSDSRQVREGDVFFANATSSEQQRRHVDQAIAHGAKAIVIGTDKLVDTQKKWQVPNLDVNQVTIAKAIYGDSHLPLIGITGTNGKTSVSAFVAQLLTAIEQPCGMIGTTGYGLLGNLEAGLNTTPDGVTILRQLHQMQSEGALSCAMEVSSHAIDQGRVSGIEFETVVFTNLSRDHLDYHGNMTHYGDTKARLLSWSGIRHVVLNIDDSWCQTLVPKVQALRSSPVLLTYSIDTDNIAADVCVQAAKYHLTGVSAQICTPLGSLDVQTGLIGAFNLSNLLAAITVLVSRGITLDRIQDAIQQITPVAGRMEAFGGDNQPLVLVDYAHSPDALESALLAAKCHVETGALWCVFGCGGNRDRGKRALMGKVAECLADNVVVTDDNPRFEASDKIIEDIRLGFVTPEKVITIAERKRAICFAITQAKPQDVVLVAGKGHEDYQEINGHRLAFSDREAVKDALRAMQVGSE